MLSSVRSLRPTIAKRFQSHAAHAEPVAKASTFNNKFHFDINPPQTHQYWNYRNGSVLFLFVPLFLTVGYLGQYTGANLGGFEGLIRFADSEYSPLKDLKYGEPQLIKKD